MSSAAPPTPNRRSLVRSLLTSWRSWPLYGWLLLLALMLLTPGLLTNASPTDIDPLHRLQAPGADSWLGTDEFGRSLQSRIVFGGRLTLLVALSSIGIATLVGVPLGTLAGYFGGWFDSVVMRMQDALLALPGVLLAILLVSTFGASFWVLVASIAVIFMPRFARLQRGTVLFLRERMYVEASRSAGASSLRIIVKDILPNSLGPLIVQITLGLAVAVLIEAGLSYLGLGIQPPNATWGLMLKTSQTYVRLAPHYVVTPGVFLFITVLVFNLLGDELRQHLDPAGRGRR